MRGEQIGDLEQHLLALDDTGFGNTEGTSGRTLQPFSIAAAEGARQLLRKALLALADGDEGRAAGLIGRAARLPHDDHADADPGYLAAHMMLFDLVTTEMEESVTEDGKDDLGWLEGAIDVLRTTAGPGRSDLRDTLQVISTDYEITATEMSMIRPLLTEYTEGDSPWGRREPAEVLERRIRAILQTCLDYLEALDAH